MLEAEAGFSLCAGWIILFEQFTDCTLLAQERELKPALPKRCHCGKCVCYMGGVA